MVVSRPGDDRSVHRPRPSLYGRETRRWGIGLVLLLLAVGSAVPVQAQSRPSERQLRTYVPPDQLVSFLPSTPFTQFVDFLNPIFERVTGKPIVDTEGIEAPIGIPVAGYHFIDAFELVLDYNGLTYRETDKHFLIEVAPEPEMVVDAAAARGQAAAAPVEGPVATLDTREVQINAILFEVNHTRARDLGIDWNVFFGGSGGGEGEGGGQAGGRAGGGGGEEEVTFEVRTDRFFENLDDYLNAPEAISMTKLTQFFRVLETNGAGETVANPQITVQSGEEGRIQIGTDIPVQIRDFSGNTVTQFYSTGIIVKVLPTLLREALADTAGAPEMEFLHLDVSVEKSNGQPSFAGLTINRNQAETEVLLLDGEQTVIGGLYSTDESVTRRGIPVLKDLPGWFFGLRYVFGYEHRSQQQKELLIVLQADLLDPLLERARRPGGVDLLEQRRRQIEESLHRTSPRLREHAPR